MPLAIPNTYTAAFQYWKSVRTRLEHTIQDYVDACSNLEAILRNPASTPSRPAQEQTFADVDLELPSLPLLEQKLRVSRLSLNYTRNLSVTLAPINRLPSEVLAMIFSLANRKWINPDYILVGPEAVASVTTLSSVCSQWRRLMLRSASFWIQIDLVLSGQAREPRYEMAQLWVERSQEAPLDISVSRGEDMFDAGVDVTGSEISQALAFLGPLMWRVRKLKIQAEGFSSPNDVDRFLGCWIRNGISGSAESLAIHMSDDLEHFPGDGSAYDFPINFSAFFSSLRSLRLQNALIDFGRVACAELTELHLEYMDGWEPTASDIASILASSPKLRSLTLVEVYPSSFSTPASGSVALNELETLTLESDEFNQLWSILRLISSTSNSIHLSLSLTEAPEHASELLAFTTRCKVTMLSLYANSGGNAYMTAALARLPCTQTLALKSFTLSAAFLQDFLDQRAAFDPPVEIWSRLRELYLIDCDPRTETVRLIARLLPLNGAIFVYDNNPDFMLNIQRPARQQLRDEMLRRDVQLEWANEGMDSQDPTNRWEFVYH